MSVAVPVSGRSALPRHHRRAAPRRVAGVKLITLRTFRLVQMASPGMMVMVAVPEGMMPGQQMQVDPDGPQGPLPPVVVTVGALSRRVPLPSAVRARPLLCQTWATCRLMPLSAVGCTRFPRVSRLDNNFRSRSQAWHRSQQSQRA